MKTYVLTLAKLFQRTHPESGKPTDFKNKLQHGEKIHTIRANYMLWKNRVEEVQQGNACISIRQWSGIPYRSKQQVLDILTSDHNIGIQRLVFHKDKDGMPSLIFFDIDGKYIDVATLANNDGLSTENWQNWFIGYDLSKPMAIIQFTNFRY